MSTRGAAGFRIHGQDKIAYNHYDSYPNGMGLCILEELRQLLITDGIEGVREAAANLRVIDGETPPTREEQERFQEFYRADIGSRRMDDWHVLLFGTQPSRGLGPLLKAGICVDHSTFLADSLFCEWAYVVNVDEALFEVYRGFGVPGKSVGRYSTMARADINYPPVSLVKSVPFDEIKACKKKKLLALIADVEDAADDDET